MARHSDGLYLRVMRFEDFVRPASGPLQIHGSFTGSERICATACTVNGAFPSTRLLTNTIVAEERDHLGRVINRRRPYPHTVSTEPLDQVTIFDQTRSYPDSHATQRPA